MDGAAWIPVGRLRRTRGNRGELLGEIYSAKRGRSELFKEVALDAGGRRRQATVERIWFHHGTPVFKFAGIDTISDAEPWEGADVLVAPEEQVPLEPDEYTHTQLIGCRVLCREHALGVVTKVEEFGGPPLLAVGTADGRELLIPFVGAMCREIDVVAKIIRVELPEGLLELP